MWTDSLGVLHVKRMELNSLPDNAFYVIDDPYQEPTGDTDVATDPKIMQVLAQNALIGQALYDLTQVLGAMQHTEATDALLQDAKTQVNALDPARFVFP